MQIKRLSSLKFLSFYIFFWLVFSSFIIENKSEAPPRKFPYKQANLSERQAVEHLLNRFTFGVREKDIDLVVKMGLENWFKKQLEGKEPETDLTMHLKGYEDLSLSNKELQAMYVQGPQLRKMALAEKVLTEEELKNDNQKEFREKLNDYRKSKSLKTEYELIAMLTNQKTLRAVYSINQMHEVLTDFWFNHFNVSITKNQSRQFIPVYERDAIRPFVTGNFGDMLLATAQSPAMLTYLDNFLSMGENEEMNAKIEKLKKNKPTNRPKGLNENYAREVMELHTLGVDAGYTQTDVTEAARILTGWTIYPTGTYGSGAMVKLLDRLGEDRMDKMGFVHNGDFLFASNLHDSNKKTVMGKQYNGGGYQEGKDFLNFLATHAASAKFISKKLATRFTKDQPSEILVNDMAEEFLKSKGDISKVLWVMVMHQEFWSSSVLGEKTKSPFEYAVSSLRALNADVKNPIVLNNWITKMGQKLYSYQAPTGYPDKAQYWINTGNLLNRMNFGLALASKKIPGVSHDLAALNQNHEPESAEDALKKYGAILLPERNLSNTFKRLEPLVKNEKFAEKVQEAAEKTVVKETMMEGEEMIMRPKKMARQENKNFGDNSMLAQVVGIIIGSPEFQKK